MSTTYSSAADRRQTDLLAAGELIHAEGVWALAGANRWNGCDLHDHAGNVLRLTSQDPEAGTEIVVLRTHSHVILAELTMTTPATETIATIALALYRDAVSA